MVLSGGAEGVKRAGTNGDDRLEVLEVSCQERRLGSTACSVTLSTTTKLVIARVEVISLGRIWPSRVKEALISTSGVHSEEMCRVCETAAVKSRERVSISS